MPGYLFHFCSEWQRARKVLQLDTETLSDLLSCLVEDHGELCEDSEMPVALRRMVQQYSLTGWRLDINAAAEAGIPIPRLAQDDMGDTRSNSTASNAMIPTVPRIPKGQVQSPLAGGRNHNNLSKTLSSTFSKSFGGEHWAGGGSPPAKPKQVLFRDPTHPLSSLPAELCKEEFIHEVRRRLVAEHLFPVGRHNVQDSTSLSLMSFDDADDLFEALVLLQGRSDGVSLLTTSELDGVCDKFFALNRLRQLMERGATSLSAFFNMLDVGGRKGLEPRELKRYMKNAGGELLSGMASALAAEGVDVNKLAETLFTALDANKDAKVELWEMKRQLSLAAAPRMSLVEVVGHFEMKNGYGKCGLADCMNRSQLFDHLSRKEGLDLSPEDVAKCFRALGDRSRLVHVSDFDTFLKCMPLEVSWGVEPFAANQLYCAIGARLLQLERSKQMDACLPPEALLALSPQSGTLSPDGDEVRSGDDDADVRWRLDRFWDRCVLASAPSMVAGSAGGKQLRDSVQRRIVEAIETIKDRLQASWKPLSPNGRPQSPKGGPRLGRAVTLPRSLFPNVSDVLVTASTQLHVGQACVVRYRLTGLSNFWGPNHDVLANDRDAMPWPCPRKLLGDTPFIGLVPCGLHWNGGGGGGFYHGTQAFATVDPNLRGDLPRDPTSGHSLLYGTVDIVPPSLIRTARTGTEGICQEFELRLFCATKSKIIGCIGEPLAVTVVHQVRPPPVAMLQVRCEGRSAVLKWKALDLGPQARKTGVEAVRLHMKSALSERCFSLEADATQWDLEDLAPDTEYEFRVRFENRAGPGREATATVRTNACCAAPATLVCAVSKTSYVDLKWGVPKTIGNEGTKDRFQQHREAIACYQASLSVLGDEKEAQRHDASQSKARDSTSSTAVNDLAELVSSVASPTARLCKWPVGSWKKAQSVNIQNDELIGRLSGLRPDTRYTLEGFCGVTSMGKGAQCRGLTFWTVPQVPRIASVRVKNGKVLVALSQTGGVCVQDFHIVVSMTDKPNEKVSFELTASNLRDDHPGCGPHPELTLPFESMPPTEDVKNHSVSLRASNPGGWSEWSAAFEAQAISRQQGAEQAQVILIQAMKERRIDALSRLLAEVREIEFQDTQHVEKATSLLQQLLAARMELNKTMQARDPGPLREALMVAQKVQLPDIGKAEVLLRKLEGVVMKLETAKGIEALRLALRAAHEARLPPKLLTAPIQRLGTREAAQQGLLEAMEAARVLGLAAALETCVGMHLPIEDKAQRLLAHLQHSESLLNAAIEKRLIVDLVSALRSADKHGLRQDELIHSAKTLLDELREKQEFHRSHIEGAMKLCHPWELKAKLDAAQFAQVLDSDMQAGRALLDHLAAIIKRNELAIGVDQREDALKAAYESEVPASLLFCFEDQLAKFKAVLFALDRGSVELLRGAIKDADAAGVKLVEMAEAKVVYADWHRANHELEVSLSLALAGRLRKAIKAALKIGIAADQLESTVATLKALDKRDKAQARLEQAMLDRKCEPLQEALKAACDAEVDQTEMLQEAHHLTHHLTQMRLELSAAIDTNDLKRVFETYGQISTKPALPEKEQQRAKVILKDLQSKELEEINKEMIAASDNGKWRLLDYLALRAKRVASFGVQVHEEDIEEAEFLACEKAESERIHLENTVIEARINRDCQTWEHAVPCSGEVSQLATGMVTGDLTLFFNPGGTYLATLPREIVECQLKVPVEEIDGEVVDIGKTQVIVDHLLRGLRKLLSAEDDIQRICKRTYDGANKLQWRQTESAIVEGCLELYFAVYVRAAHSGTEVAEALVERGHLGGDLWQEESALCIADSFVVQPPEVARTGSSARALSSGRPGRAYVREQPSAVVTDIASTLSRSLTDHTVGGGSWTPGPARIRRLCDHITNLRPRVLRRISVELGWCYSRGLMDSLDATCLAFDQDRLVEIVDHRGYHGLRYGAGSGSGKGQNGPDATDGAVRHAGDVMDDEVRTGKQVMHIRLDLMPQRITDLVFVLSAYNSRDLAKFSELTSTILESDGASELASAKSHVSMSGTEAIIMCSVYRLSDGLWRANSLMSPCKGTARDYRPVLSRLLELGYPRKVSMRQQVTPLFKGMRTHLSLAQAAKAARVTVCPENTMRVSYAIELFSNSFRGPEHVEQISSTDFHKDVLLQALYDTPGGERFSENHVVVHPPSTKDFRDARLELSWNYPSNRRGYYSAEDPPPQEESFLDATCICFEGQALREIVDYRGAHGVRIVHNGVVDYAGVWVGKVNIGDATGGAVWHAGEEVDNASRVGKQFMEARLDLLPRGVTDLFFTMSAPTNGDITKYSQVSLRVIDGVNPGHELGSVQWNPKEEKKEKFGGHEPMEAVILCSLSRAPSGEPGWQLVSFGCLTQGNTTDYRAMILCLRAIQANRYPKPPPWPHQVALDIDDKCEREIKDKQALMLPQLPKATVLQKCGSQDDEDDETSSEIDESDEEKEEEPPTAATDLRGSNSIDKVANVAGAALRFLGRRTSSLKGTTGASVLANMRASVSLRGSLNSSSALEGVSEDSDNDDPARRRGSRSGEEESRYSSKEESRRGSNSSHSQRRLSELSRTSSEERRIRGHSK